MRYIQGVNKEVPAITNIYDLKKMSRHILQVILAVALSLSVTERATAAIVTTLSGLNIGGSTYTATLHPMLSFNEVWDVDGDAVFGESDGSLVNHAPTFFNDDSNATSALIAVISALGKSDTINGVHDGILLPFSPAVPPNYSPGEQIIIRLDQDTTPQNDSIGTIMVQGTDFSPSHAWVSFEEEPSMSTVPIPPTMLMFIPGLFALIGFRKHSSNKS